MSIYDDETRSVTPTYHNSRPAQAGPTTDISSPVRQSSAAPHPPAPRALPPSHGYLGRRCASPLQLQVPHWCHPVSISTNTVLVYIDHRFLSRRTHSILDLFLTPPEPPLPAIKLDKFRIIYVDGVFTCAWISYEPSGARPRSSAFLMRGRAWRAE